MAVLLALAAAVGWGAADFLGGKASRRDDPLAVAARAEIVGVLAALALILPTPVPPASDVLWSIAAGILGGLATAVLYAAIARGGAASTAPVAAIVTGAGPVLAAFALDGRPSAIGAAGLTLGVAAIAWTSLPGAGARTPAGPLALAASAGVLFAAYYLCLDQARRGAGLWPVLLSHFGAVWILTTVLQYRPARLSRRGARTAVAIGLCLAAATVAFVAATHMTSSIATVAVVASMYPAVTIALSHRFDGSGAAPVRYGALVLAALAVAALAFDSSATTSR